MSPGDYVGTGEGEGDATWTFEILPEGNEQVGQMVHFTGTARKTVKPGSSLPSFSITPADLTIIQTGSGPLEDIYTQTTFEIDGYARIGASVVFASQVSGSFSYVSPSVVFRHSGFDFSDVRVENTLDIIASDLSWNPATNAFDYSYELETVGELPLPQAPQIDFFWSSSWDIADRIGPAIASRAAATTHGTHADSLGNVDFSSIPENAQYLLMAIDSEGINDALGEVSEWNNDVAVEIPRFKDLAVMANSVTYLPGPTLADDKIRLTYDVFGLTASEQLNLGLYWSTQANDIEDRVLAYYTTDAPHSGSFDVAVTALSTSPSNAPFLVMYVDDDGSTLSGFVEESNENNNIASLDITPDIFIVPASTEDNTQTDWNLTAGGLDVAYDVKNRAFASNFLVTIKWSTGELSSGSPASPNDFNARHDARILHIGPSLLVAPGLHDNNLRIELNPSDGSHPDAIGEITRDNNSIVLAMPDLRPKLEFEVDADSTRSKSPERKQPYSLQLVVTNDSPLPLNYQLDWHESASESNGTVAVTDATTNGPANHSKQDHQFTLGFNETTKIDFGTFRRTWKWIPDLPQEAASTLDLLHELVGSLTSGMRADVINTKLKTLLGELSDKTKSLGSVGDFIEHLATEASNRDADPTSVPAVTMEYLYDLRVLTNGGALVHDGQAHPENVPIIVSQTNKGNLQLARALAANLAGYYSALEELLTPTSITGVLESSFGRHAIDATLSAQQRSTLAMLGAYAQAIDPPDFQFNQLVEVEPAVIDRHGFWQSTDSVQHAIESRRAAIAISRDRELGAQLSGDDFWTSRQGLRISELAHESALLYTHAIAAEELKHSWISATFADGSLTGFSDDAAARGALLNAGLNPEQIDMFLALRGSVSADYGESTSDTFITTIRFKAALSMQTAMEDLLGSIATRVSKLGANVLSISQESLTGLSAAEAALEGQVRKGIYSDATRRDVESFLRSVRDLLVSTNNIESLRPHLEFGYGALFALQQAAVEPTAVIAVIDELVANGQVSAADATRLTDLLQSIDGILRTGDIDTAIARYPEVTTLVGELTASGLDPAIASTFNDYVSTVETQGVGIFPIANAGGPYTISDRSTFMLDGSSSTDADQSANTLTYEWDLDYDGITFDVDASGQKPTISPVGGAGEKTIALRVTDSGTLANIATTTLTIVNNSPEVAANQAFLMNLAAIKNAVVGKVIATDLDAGQTLLYAITTDSTGGAFSIDPGTGQIVVTDVKKLPKLAKGQTTVNATLHVTATDNGSPFKSSGGEVTVTLSKTAAMSPIISDQAFITSENNRLDKFGNPLKLKIGTVKLIAAYKGQKFSNYSLHGADAAGFVIDAKGIIFATNRRFNFEDKSVYTFQVTASDKNDASKTTTATVTVNVRDLNEAPQVALLDANNTIVDKLTLTIPEHTPNGQIIGRLLTTDPDGGAAGQVTVTFPKGFDQAFAYDATTGDISVRDATKLDYELIKSHQLVFAAIAKDGAVKPVKPATTKFTLVVKLADMNDAPIDIKLALAKLPPGSLPIPAGTTFGTLQANDPDKTPQTFTYSLVVGPAAIGTNNDSFLINETTGVVTSAPSTSLARKSLFSILVRVTDQGGLSFERLFTLKT